MLGFNEHMSTGISILTSATDFVFPVYPAFSKKKYYILNKILKVKKYLFLSNLSGKKSTKTKKSL